MSEFIKTLFEEKEKLDEICHIEEQQRKKIQKHLDTLTDDQIKEMSFEDKVLLKEKYGFFIDTKLVNLLHREIKNGLIKAKGPAIHYPFLKGLVFLTKEQIYDLDEFVNQMRNLNALTQSLANRKLNDTLKETAEYENIEYKEMTLTGGPSDARAQQGRHPVRGKRRPPPCAPCRRKRARQHVPARPDAGPRRRPPDRSLHPQRARPCRTGAL